MKSIFITGAAHGIGLATAKHFAAQGWFVGLYDINSEALRIEWAKHDIRVTAVKPPLVNTQMGHSVRPELMKKFSVDMEPEDVAEAIQRAAQGKHTGYLLGTTSKIWAWLDKHLPEAGRRRLTRYLTDH